MNIFSKILFVLLIMFLFGCVIISKKELIETQKSSIIADQDCGKVSTSVTYLRVLNDAFSGEYYSDPYEKNRGGIRLSSYYIAEQLKYRNIFNLKSDDEDKQKIFIEFQTHISRETNFFQKTWHWVMFFTIGVIPSWGPGDEYLIAVVKDANGNILREFKSHKVEFTYLNGLIFLPFNFFHSYTPASLEEEFVPKMTDNIIDQMLASRIICE